MSTSEWDSTDRAEAEAIDGVEARRERDALRTPEQVAEGERFVESLRRRHLMREVEWDSPF